MKSKIITISVRFNEEQWCYDIDPNCRYRGTPSLCALGTLEWLQLYRKKLAWYPKQFDIMFSAKPRNGFHKHWSGNALIHHRTKNRQHGHAALLGTIRDFQSIAVLLGLNTCDYVYIRPIIKRKAKK